MSYKAQCRGCPRTVTPGHPCSHLRLTDDGRPFLVHPQHQEEPDPYAEVTEITEDEADEIRFGKVGPLEKALKRGGVANAEK